MPLSLKVLGLLACLTLLACAGRTGSAPKLADGSAIAIMVHTDKRITPDMEPDRVTQINQLGDWMESDLVAILNKYGYQAAILQDAAQATPGVGRFVLNVAITDYNAGSKAARMIVGFGAGAAVLRTHFELYGEQATAPLIVGDPDVGSGRDWRNAARKVNLQTAEAANARITQQVANPSAPLAQVAAQPQPLETTTAGAAPGSPAAAPAQ